MPRISDPLLSWTQRLLRVLSGLSLLSAGLMLVIGLLALIFGVHTSRYATPLPDDATTPLFLLALVPLLAVYGWFLLTLRRIVDSVMAGSPFVAINADRLTRMGWIAVLMKAIALIESGAMASGAPDIARFASRFPGPNLVMILVLFILARVFRQGAAMREDLEGTV